MSEDEDKRDLLPPSTPLEDAYDLAAIVSGFVPWFGGAINDVLSGISLDLKMERVGEVLEAINSRIEGLEDSVAHEYVRSDDFRELLERTLRQVAYERSEEKRRVYAAFLADDIANPGEPYDEKIRFLRTLEELQTDHIRLLKAYSKEPTREEESGYSGSIAQTLIRRLPDMKPERIHDLASQLQDLKLVTHTSINTMMTARGAAHIYNYISPYGKRFTKYIMQGEDGLNG